MPSNPMLEAAIRYARMGWPVIPLRGKIPLTQTGSKGWSTDEKQLRDWWMKTPWANVGLCTGHKFWALDIDIKTGGDETIALLQARHGRLPDTIQQTTGTGGRHYLLAPPGFPIYNSAGLIGEGIDTRGDGGYIVVAPSIHPDTKRRYEWDGMREIENQVIAPAPEWLLALLKTTRKGSSSPSELPDKFPEGKRNELLFRNACRMRAFGLTEKQLLGAVQAMNLERCQPPLEAEEVRSITESAARYKADTIRTPPPLPEEPAGSARKPTKQSKTASPTPTSFHTPGEVLGLAGGLEPYLANKHRQGVLSPWGKLNGHTGGMHPGELVILAAATGIGKTSWSLHYGYHVASGGTGVVLFSLEMSEVEVTDRLMCIADELNSVVIREAEGPEGLERAADLVAELPLFIVDHSYLTLEMARITIADIRKKHEIGLVIFDYLQLMSSAGKQENRTQEVSAISRGLKLSAKENQVPFLAVSQLTRSSRRENRPPELFDLRDSGQIEQDANVVLFLHQPIDKSKPRYKDSPESYVAADLIIAKQRSGPSGMKVPLWFRTDCGRFEESRRST